MAILPGGYQAGKNHGNADAMSRIPSTEVVMSVFCSELGGDPNDLQAAQSADPKLAPIIMLYLLK